MFTVFLSGCIAILWPMKLVSKLLRICHLVKHMGPTLGLRDHLEGEEELLCLYIYSEGMRGLPDRAGKGVTFHLIWSRVVLCHVWLERIASHSACLVVYRGAFNMRL